MAIPSFENYVIQDLYTWHFGGNSVVVMDSATASGNSNFVVLIDTKTLVSIVIPKKKSGLATPDYIKLIINNIL